MNFDLDFFIQRLETNGFKLKKQKVSLQNGLLPGISYMEVLSLFENGFLSILFVNTDKMTRRSIIRAARHFTQKRPIKNLLIFSNITEAILVMFPYGFDGPVRILHLEDRLYHTDEEALNSIRYSDDLTELSRFIESYLPYEKVRDDFFNGYRERYQSLVSILHEHGFPPEKESEYAQRFLGRLMFLYFLQRKGWLAGDKDFIDKIGDYRELNEVFYNGLNNPQNQRGIPYLNGSLFDREDYLTEKMVNEQFDDLTSFFKEARSFFNRYNFTVDESSPFEVEVSIDPYLLGTVFENMLPENERGGKGTFYTPPVEISFIIRRAISNYLALDGFDTKDEVQEDKFKDGLERYISLLKGSRNPAELEEFKEKLINAVVVDPAVGSGGFLVIYMDEVVRIINEAEIAVIGEITSPKILKEKIINNIYGFDIENEAVEIARLRVWLSYVIDEDKPRPLPNLDLNIVTVTDSLQSVSSKGELFSFDQTFREMKAKYMHEPDKNKKKKLKSEIKEYIRKLYDIKDNFEYLEYYLVDKANIILINPPYVRQESIDKNRKDYYTITYKLDKKSDLYTYFFVRSVSLLAPKGIVSVISSDKWLETGYGISLQDYLKNRLIAVYGQRERSFGADVNTVISVFSNEMLKTPVQFTYLEKYSYEKVRQSVSIERGNLKPGKWFYLRAPKIFIEKILPKLTHKLGDFAEIKRGFTTGANDFFYMKDVSSQYEADYIANPKKFENWGVSSKNEKELKDQGLIYIENEEGEKFVIEEEDTTGLVRSPRQIQNYLIPKLGTLVFMPKGDPQVFSRKYIQWGESKGYDKRPTTKNRHPWYKLPDFKPAHILMPMSLMDMIYIPFSEDGVICDARLYGFYSNLKNLTNIWLYLNSIIFYITIELFSRRLGGGGGALDIKVEDYEEMPCPDLSKLIVNYNYRDLLNRKPDIYFKELEHEDRKKLDSEVLKSIGIININPDELYREFLELVEDRLIKADRPLRSQEVSHDEDN